MSNPGPGVWDLIERLMAELMPLLRRAEMVGELIGLTDAQLDARADPLLVAGNQRSIREVCEHVLAAQRWITSGVEDAIAAHRDTGDAADGRSG
jgi:hypothetical protein